MRTLTFTFSVWAMLCVMLMGCAATRSPIQPNSHPTLAPNSSRLAASNTGNGKPVAMPMATPTEGGIPLQVHLYDGGSYDPDGDELVVWEWNFADEEEGKGGWHDYTSTQGDAWHTYLFAGTYTAHLRVTDSTGRKGVAHIQIQLDSSFNANPMALAHASLTYGIAPLTVNFSTTGSYDPDGTIIKYEWDLGDGVFQDYTATNGETTHTYITENTYITILRVTDDGGAVGTNSAVVEVLSSPCMQPGDWWMFGREPTHTRRSPYVGAQTNNVRWTYPIQYGKSSPAIGADGTIYVGGSYLYAINPSGRPKWENWVGTFADSSPAIGADGTVYIGSMDHQFYAINPDGTKKWAYMTGGGIHYSSPAIGTDGTIYIGSVDNEGGNTGGVGNKLYAINPDGTLKWAYTTSGYVYSSPAIGTDGIIYVGCDDSKLYAINPDGTLKWAYMTGYGYGYSYVQSSPAIGIDGTVYVGIISYMYGGSKLYAINPDGTLKWAYTTSGYVESSPAIGADGTVYIGCHGPNGRLYSINPDGTLKWAYTTSESIDSSPAIGADGTVYVGCNNGQFYAINPDGTLKWAYTTSESIDSSPAIGADGTVYIACRDGKLYAFGS